MRRQVLMIRTAISPRLAIRIFENILVGAARFHTMFKAVRRAPGF